MKIRITFGLVVGLVLLLTATSIYAQSGCFDAAGGPIPCTPTPELAPPPQDSDFDGISDFNDQCPTQPGPASNNGCPLPGDIAAPPTPVPPPVTFPNSVECLVTGYGEPVNIRSGPGLNYAVINTLQPGSFVITYFLLINGQGEGWYSTLAGWVAQSAVQGNANCDAIPVVTTFPSGRAIFIPEELQDFANPPGGTDGAPPPDPFCQNGTIIIIDGQAFCRLDLDIAAFPAGTEGAPPPPPFCEDGEIVIIDGAAYCRLNLDIAIAGGTAEGAPPPEPFCQNGTIVIIDGAAYCRLDLDFAIPADTSEGAPPPPPFCVDGTIVIIDGAAYCRLDLDIAIATDPAEGAPPPEPFCENGIIVIIDGAAYCRLDLDIAAFPAGTEGAPPPPPFCVNGEIVIIDGQAYCRLILDITFAGGTAEGAPPPPPFCEDGEIVIIDGQAYCRLNLDFTIPVDPAEGAPPPPPFCENGEIVIIDGAAYCRLILPIALAPSGGTEGAPPPDPFDCAYYVVIDGSVVCLIPEEVADIAIDIPTEAPMPQTREHILLARQVGSDCPQAVGLLLPAVQKVRAAAARMTPLSVEDLLALPESDPCDIDLLLPAAEFDVEGGIVIVADVLRVGGGATVDTDDGAQICVENNGVRVCTPLPQ